VKKKLVEKYPKRCGLSIKRTRSGAAGLMRNKSAYLSEVFRGRRTRLGFNEKDNSS